MYNIKAHNRKTSERGRGVTGDIRVRVISEDYYPFYVVVPEGEIPNPIGEEMDYGFSLDLSDAEYNMVKECMDNFIKAQDFLDNKYRGMYSREGASKG